jgi:hypothetical protein
MQRKFHLTITKEYLYQKLVVENLDPEDVAAELGCCRTTVYNYRRKYGFVSEGLDDLTDKVFTYWTVLKQVRSNKEGKRMFLCKCKCGQEKPVLAKTLLNGDSKSCNCYSYVTPKHPRFKGCGNIHAKFWKQIQKNGYSRNLSFDITIEFAWELFLKQKGKCALSGVDLIFAEAEKFRRRKRICTASLDRIDSSKGYLPDNVQWVHKDINKMKWQLTNEEFLKFCQKCVIYNQEKLKENNNAN